MSQPPVFIEPRARNKKLFCFGFGYTAGFLAERLMGFGWKVSCTVTSAKKRDFLASNGVDAHLFDYRYSLPDPDKILSGTTHLLLSVPPGRAGDPVFAAHGSDILRLKKLEWAGYLSATSVYGDQDGNWVDETTRPAPNGKRGRERLEAEQQWQSLTEEGLPLHTFRLAGIYGPNRSALDTVRSGHARCIDKPGHMFNRIHVEDIVQALIASMNQPRPGAIYNVADDMPAPSCEVTRFACVLTGSEPPLTVPYDQAEMPPALRSFYKDNKRVKNDLLKDELNLPLLYPDYRAGLRACLEVESEASDLLGLTSADMT